MSINFSLKRLWAVIIKEFWQIKRDKPTLGMMVTIPIMQLILFGFAINTNPKHLPAVIVSADNSAYVRTFSEALRNTEYFQFLPGIQTEEQAENLLLSGKILFIVSIPPNFSRDLSKGKTPQILLDTDATDSVSTGSAISAINNISSTVFNPDLQGSLSHLQATAPPANLVIHSRYNPEAITQYNIVSALLGVILTLTMAFITALTMTRESERGTMENLLSTPLRPSEIIIGKITPYILVGYIQVILILLIAKFVFALPYAGNIYLLLFSCFFFITANLSVGLMFSTIAENQLQAVQGAVFFFLPSQLLSGFMFPFLGMPRWAQIIGNTLPLTHFIIIVRGILLKDMPTILVLRQIVPIILFTMVTVFIGLKWFRQTLD